jgi:hypothetical protein
MYYSQLTQDKSLLTTVHIQSASTFFYLADPTRALQIYQDVLPTLKECSILTQGHFYVKQAAAYAQCGKVQEARESLDHAYSHFSDHLEHDPAFSYADFGSSSFFLWEGLTLLELARHGHTQPQEAWNVLAKMENFDSRVIMSERNRMKIVNRQAEKKLFRVDLRKISG